MSNEPTSNDSEQTQPAVESPNAPTVGGDAPRSESTESNPSPPESQQPPAPAESTKSPNSESPIPESPGPKGGKRPKIGRQPGVEPKYRHPGARGPAIPEPRKGPVPVPSKRADAVNPDLDRELEAAMAGVSLDDMMDHGASSAVVQQLDFDKRYRASVVRIHGENVFFAINGPNEGIASIRQFDEIPEVGAQVDVIVRGINDGIYEVAVPGASIDVTDWEDIDEGAIVEATVTGSNTGGLECTVNRIRGFIPASQIAIYRIEDFSEFVGQKLLCVVTEANERRGNLVLSRRAVLEREKEEGKQKLMAELEVGQQRDGIVRKLMDFGAFVDLGGVDGLIPISKLSWDRIKHPSEVLEEGQNVRVNVDSIDPQNGRIGLSYRSEADHPWKDVETTFPVNALVKGTVSRIANFGAFVKLAPGVEGLVHVSELAHRRVSRVTAVCNEGDTVEVRVLSVDAEAQKMSLSIKAAQAKPNDAGDDAAEEEVIEQESSVKNKHTGPLKGGVDRPSGGDQFGLKW